MSFCVAQNWSIQVKYASRHALYPVPNVFDDIVFCVAVRADLTVFIALRVLPFVGVRVTVLFVRVAVAAREDIGAFAGRVLAVCATRVTDGVRAATRLAVVRDELVCCLR